MALDPYSLCPCGNGKKIKFCCLDIAADMEKVGRLKSNGQTAQALKAVEKVREKSPDTPWGITTHAALLNDAQRFDEARGVLVGLLKAEPSHPLGNALYAMTEFNLSGWPEAKKIVNRAFKACLKHRPDAIFSLAHAVADQLIDDDDIIAARQYLAIAMRFAPQDVRQQVFVKLMELDADSSQFYPLRGTYSLQTTTVPDSVQEPFEKAMRVASIGCFSEAVDSLQALVTEGDWGADGVPTSLLADMGILHAWDGNAPAAAQSLRDAAAASDDIDEAAEWLALAALVEIQNGDDSDPLMARQFKTDELSRVVSTLDAAAKLVKAETADGGTSTLFLILDRDVPESYDAETTLDGVAKIIARASIVDTAAADTDAPQITVFGVDNGELETAVDAVQSSVGDLITEVEKPAAELTLGRVASEIEAIRWEPYFPPKTAGSVRRELSAARWNYVLSEVWPSTPSRVLGGKTPADGVDSEAAKRAALIVLDAICDTHRISVPLEELRDKFEIGEASPLEVNDDLPLNTLTITQLMRVPFDSLSDEQARLIVQRSVLTGHNRLTSKTLAAALDRGLDLGGVLEEDRAYQILIDMAQRSMNADVALDWIAKAQSHMAESEDALGPQAFEKKMYWKLAELNVRLDSPDDPATRDLLRELWEDFGQKVPEVRAHLEEVVASFDIDPPWSAVVLAGADGGTSSPSGQKLWLPGQD